MSRCRRSASRICEEACCVLHTPGPGAGAVMLAEATSWSEPLTYVAPRWLSSSRARIVCGQATYLLGERVPAKKLHCVRELLLRSSAAMAPRSLHYKQSTVKAKPRQG